MLVFRKVTFALLLLVVVPSVAFAGEVHKVGSDLYAYISSNDSSANSTFLVSDSGILVVDTGLNAIEGKKLLAEIRRISAAPVRWIVNTHYHPDHRGGNPVFGTEPTIITTGFTRDHAVPDAGNANSKARSETVTPLNLTVLTSLTLFIGGHRVDIYHPGPAHTMGDLVVYFPDQQTIATGDLFLTNSSPAMDDGDMENWISALEHMLVLPIEHVVPGHFELATKADLARFHDYLNALGQQVRDMRGKGMSLEAIKKNISLPEFKTFRQFPKYEATFADNAETYYSQLAARGR